MPMMTGSAAFLSLLADEGVTHLFGNPGTTELPIMAALGERSDLGYVLGLQEGVAMAMADGFARASGKLAACNVHVAPGLGNAMGALYNAKWYGSAVLVTAGQQAQGHGLTEPLLYDSLVPIAAPLVKWAVEVTRAEDLPRIVHRAAKIALTPPTGPAFLSLPGDVLEARASFDLGCPTRIDTRVRPTGAALEALARRLLAAHRPVLVAGHEIATHDALAEAARLAELLGAPVYQQTVAYGAHFLSEHPAFMGTLGRDQQAVCAILEAHDLLVCLGADVLRMSVGSPVDPLPSGMPIVQLGLRDREHGNNYPAEIAIHGDVKVTLGALLPVLDGRLDAPRRRAAREGLTALAARNWSSQREALGAELIASAHATPIDPRLLMLRIVEALPADAVVVEEALVSARSLLGLLPFRDPRCYFGLASGGLGFAMAGAIGIQLALPERPVVAIVGDGSALFSIQALWSAAHLALPITYVIANNAGYAILKERLKATYGSERSIGMALDDPPIDFVGLARAMGVAARRVTEPDELSTALREAMDSGGPALIDVVVAAGK